MTTADDDSLSYQDAFAALSRGDKTDITHLLLEYELPVLLADTQATVRTHFVATNANGVPAIDLLAKAMAYTALDFCIPRTRLSQAAKSFAETGSTADFSRLDRQARDLFVAADGTGEGGELLLFLLMERVLLLPQLLAKMSLKTNSNVHIHGSDGVHAKLADDGVLELSWGESKLYQSSSSAIADCFSSIAPFLVGEGDARARDLLLVRENLNVEDEALASYILRYFDETDPKALEIRWRGVCLVGFDYSDYPNIKQLAEQEAAAVSAALDRWHTSFVNQLTKQSLVDVSIDIFCIPFPDVNQLRKLVRKNMGLA